MRSSAEPRLALQLKQSTVARHEREPAQREVLVDAGHQRVRGDGSERQINRASQPRAEVALVVEVDRKHALLALEQKVREQRGDGGLADATFMGGENECFHGGLLRTDDR